jgi:hypothetical protein
MWLLIMDVLNFFLQGILKYFYLSDIISNEIKVISA